MNNIKKFNSGLVSVLTVIASIILGHTAQAANLSFTPTGSQLDNDPILDIDIGPGQIIDFTIDINTVGLTNNVGSFTYRVHFDSGELAFQNIAGLVSGGITAAGLLSVYGNNLNIPVQNSQIITTIRFITVNPGKAPHDGVFDFKISSASGSYTNGGSIPNIFTYGTKKDPFLQEVEVQVPEPTSILGLFSLGIIGAGATIKRQVKRNHSIEKETTEIG
jgi:hypothetical protein